MRRERVHWSYRPEFMLPALSLPLFLLSSSFLLPSSFPPNIPFLLIFPSSYLPSILSSSLPVFPPSLPPSPLPLSSLPPTSFLLHTPLPSSYQPSTSLCLFLPYPSLSLPLLPSSPSSPSIFPLTSSFLTFSPPLFPSSYRFLLPAFRPSLPPSRI